MPFRNILITNKEKYQKFIDYEFLKIFSETNVIDAKSN